MKRALLIIISICFLMPSTLEAETSQNVYAGTGFMFGSKDYVITNWHVIRGTKNIKVKFLNGEKINAEVLLKDPQNDIAFLKLERSPELPPSDLKVSDSSSVKMGDGVFTIGYPAHWVMGQNPKYTEGVVNALSGIKDDPTVFQISVQIQPGNSGGPLFNQNGEVIGITQSSLDPKVAIGAFGTLPQNVNYAIKSSYISTLLPMLPETLIASRGIIIAPTEPENSLSNFIDRAKNNIVLIEASTGGQINESTEPITQEQEKIKQERLKIEQERKRIAALGSLQEERRKLEEERRKLEEEKKRMQEAVSKFDNVGTGGNV